MIVTSDSTECTSQSCSSTVQPDEVTIPWHETDAIPGFPVWQIMFLCMAGLLATVIFLCCCIRFRIPRTKQEIEADFIRKKITRKFQKQLRLIHNADMDEMDLKRALDRIRNEFESDAESLAQSDALSGATLNSANFTQIQDHGSYRKASDIGVTFDELLEKQQKGSRKFPNFAGIFAKFRHSNKPMNVME